VVLSGPGVTKLLPYFQRMWISLLNLVGEKNEFRIIITSPEYVELKVLWGVISYESGEKREFVVRGTEPYVQSIVSSLSSRGLRVTKVLR
jgi:hypothetical protein